VYERILADDPHDPAALAERVLSTWAKGDVAAARRMGEEILKAAPGPAATLYVTLGNIYDDAKEQKKAEDTYRRGLKRYPDNQLLHFNLAVSLARTDQLDKARAELAAALALKPTHASSWIILGQIERRQGHPGESLAAFVRFLTLEPESPRARPIA